MEYVESGEQVALFYWAHLLSPKYPALMNIFRIPNGGKRTARQGARSRDQGERAGVPDVCLAWQSQGSQWPHAKGYPGLYIEMKSSDGRLSKDQKVWKGRLERAGYKYAVCRSWVDAAKVICAYLGMPEEGL